MITPNSLKTGDTIGIVSPGRKVILQDLEPAIKIFTEWGLKVIVSPHAVNNDHSYLAAKDNDRLSDLQEMINNPEISAIVCARGGYGTTRIIDLIDFQLLFKKPKWVVGFSDITALHLSLNRIGIESIHSTMPILFAKPDAQQSIESLRQSLFGFTPSITANASNSNRNGVASGQVVGGNLSLLVDSFSTSSESDFQHKILIVEEVDEHLYKIDRMFTQLRRTGKLNKLKGLVIGHMTNLKDTTPGFGETVEEIILDKVGLYEYPVAFNFPVGHEHPNIAWRCGSTMVLTVDKHGTSLTPASVST